MKHYNNIENIFRRYSAMNHLKNIAAWDEAVMIPPGSGTGRAMAISELEQMMAELIQSPELGEHIQSAKNEVGLDDWQNANLREAERAFNNAKVVDPILIAKKTNAAILCEQLWRKLRSENNWAEFAPKFRNLVDLIIEEAKQRSNGTDRSPYEALVDTYESDHSLSSIDTAFGILKKQLPEIISSAIELQADKKVHELGRKIEIEKQKQLMPKIMKMLGFDFDIGRLDQSHHPFCGGNPDDIRITTRYSEFNFLNGLMGVIHETGHALYEQGLPRSWINQPVGNARGMAFHESQSLFMEMQIARSKEFVEFLLPILKDNLAEREDPKHFWTTDNIHRKITQVARSYIRVDADEVTYPAHVILRYEIEKALIEQEIEVEDIPAIWDEKMNAYLGLSTVSNFKDGCMQDVHWPAGLFGYFPFYTLGALISAQMFSAIEKDNSEARNEIRMGNFTNMTTWLKCNIWSQASKFRTQDLILASTGESLNVNYFLGHLNKRYLSSKE